MLIKEYRIVMPMTLEEYKCGQLWSTAESSKRETGGGNGVEILVNELFDNYPLLGGKFRTGQYTKKKYYLASKVNSFLRTILPKPALVLEENSWNAFPYCRTIVTNDYMHNEFGITIESFHAPGRGELDNVHELPPDKLSKREVILIDIAADLICHDDYNSTEDPRLVGCASTKRGPLREGWIRTADPVMTCYKLVTCHFNWFGMQGRVEKLIQHYEQRLFTRFHRQVFCWMDRWYGLTLEEIRKFEIDAQHELETQRKAGPLRGACARD